MPGQEPGTPAPQRRTAGPSAQRKGRTRLPAAPAASKATATKCQPGTQPLPRREGLTEGSHIRPSSPCTTKPSLHQRYTGTSSPVRLGTHPATGSNGYKSPAARELVPDLSTPHPLKLGLAQEHPPSLVQEQLAQLLRAPEVPALRRANGCSPAAQPCSGGVHRQSPARGLAFARIQRSPATAALTWLN